MSLGGFALDISRFVDKANGNLNVVVRKVALDVFGRVIQKSPVDTGRFKGAWLCAVGSAPGGAPETLDKTGAAAMARVHAALAQMQAGQVVYLVNNLPYARPLEYGWSKQAPAGMVRLTLQEFPYVVQTAAAEVAK